MKAAVLAGKEKIEIEERDIPKPREYEVLIKTEVCGICAYDLSVFHEKSPSSYPMVLGHEPVGEIVEMGSKVSNASIGERVTGCGDKALAEYSLLSYDRLAKIPQDTKEPAMHLSEPVTCVVMGLKNCGIEFGDSVVIIGAGYFGLLYVQALAAKQLSQLIVVDVREERLKMAKEFGADVVLNAATDDVVKEIRKIYPRGVNVVIEATGNKAVYNTAADILTNQGTMGIFGWHFGEELFPMGRAMDLGLKIKILGVSTTRNGTKDFYSAVSLLNRGTFDQSRLITHYFKLNESEEAFRMATEKPEGFIKSVVTF